MEKVEQLIPQRPPFQMIDGLKKIEPGVMAIAEKNVSINEWFFRNTTQLTMPRTLLIEALAQTGATVILSVPEFKTKNAFFGGIRTATFLKDVVPGDVLSLEVEMIKMKGPIGIGKGIIKVAEQIICEAELTFIVG